MLVTIITVAFNSGKTIAKAMESVLNQTYENIEYIVVDGASTDNTVEVAKSFQSAFDAKDGRSLTIISEPDQGMYDALNKGARLAHGELVGQINTDDWYELDAVQTMVDLYKQTNYDAAWGSICIKKPTGDMIKHAKNGRLWTTAGWCHPASFSKRETLLRHPYPLESMSDDFDYITAVRQSGEKLEVIDKVLANYSFGGMSTQKKFKEVIRRTKLAAHIYRKYGMSRLYVVHKFALEMAKYILG